MKRIAGLLAAILLSAVPLFAQCSPYPDSVTEQTARQMGEGGTIRGRLLYPNGKPAADVELTLEPQCGWDEPVTTTTNSFGTFVFHNLIGSEYVLTGSVAGYKPIRRLLMGGGPLNITLRPLPGGPIPPTATVPVKYVNVPPEALAQFDHGILAQENGKPKEAEADFLKAIKIYPVFADAYAHLSAIYANQNRFADADKAIRKSLKLDKDNADGYAYLGYVFIREKQTDKAEAAFQKSLAISRNDWFAHLELGRLRYDQKRYAQTYPHLALARQLHPQTRSVHLLLYDDLIQLKKYAEALNELDEIVRLFPNSPETAKLEHMRPALTTAAKQQH